VTYNYYSGSSCSGTATTVSTVTVTNGEVPNSNSHGTAGPYGWNAVYSGDSGNHPATSPCEPLSITGTFYLTMNGGWVSPQSGYYTGTVSIYAWGSCDVSNPPFRGTLFRSWTGAGTGSYTGYSQSATVTMYSAITETASYINVLCPQ
jgi:hypothetical protein